MIHIQNLKTYTMSIKEMIIKLEKERDIFPKGTGPYQKYQNAINALNKMKKYYYKHQKIIYDNRNANDVR